jgi:hypothetical protein
MPTPHEKLAASITALQKLQKEGRRVFRSDELSRVHRERLLQNGFVQEVMRGWLISSSPGTRAGNSTPWYASFWEFCARYCEERFGDEWHLSPEQSLLLHSENTVIPFQTVINSPKGTNNKINLLFDTSLYDLKEPRMPPPADLTVRDGLRLFVPTAALVRVSETFFNRNPIETRAVLASVRDASELLRRLLDGGHSVVAGRLAGAFRRIGRPDVADELVTTMKTAGYAIRETDPLAPQQPLDPLLATAPPIVGRMQAMWDSMRGKVLEVFPKAPGLPQDTDGYLRFIDDIYRSDAYHSLSIEGYTVRGHTVSDAFGIPPPCSRNHQPSSRSGSPSCL